MTKRALKRQLREGAFDAGQFEGDDKIRRLPVNRGWSPLTHHNDAHPGGARENGDRDQAYLKTIKAKSPGQQQLMEAIDAKNLVLALGPWVKAGSVRLHGIDLKGGMELLLGRDLFSTMATTPADAVASLFEGRVDLVVRLGRATDGLFRVISVADSSGAPLFGHENGRFHRGTAQPSFAGLVRDAGYGEALSTVLR